MTELEIYIKEMQRFITKKRNRKAIARIAGIHTHTVSRFLNYEKGITFNKLLEIEKAVIYLKAKNPYWDKDEDE